MANIASDFSRIWAKKLLHLQDNLAYGWINHVWGMLNIWKAFKCIKKSLLFKKLLTLHFVRAYFVCDQIKIDYKETHTYCKGSVAASAAPRDQ